jgi:hypothetical protein
MTAQSDVAELKPYNKGVIWRGFSHLWSYNHRVNRLGSYVFLDSLQRPVGVYGSASGLGSDSTWYSNYFSVIESPNLRFFQGEIKIQVTGKETQLLSEKKEFSVKVPDWFQELKMYKSIINGFEIKSLERSDLPIMFEAHIDDPMYSSQSKEIKFSGLINWVGNCRSAECEVFNNGTSYEITLHYLIIGYDTEKAMCFEFNNKYAYEWTTYAEPKEEVLKKQYQVIPNKYNMSAIGIKSFGFILNEEQWLQAMNYRISIDNYKKNEGIIQASILMNFLAWKEGMKQNAVAKKKAMFAHRKPGWVSLSLNSAIIQFNEGKIIDGTSSGGLYWPGWNANASGTKASEQKFLKF